jgi:hypothetical protein
LEKESFKCVSVHDVAESEYTVRSAVFAWRTVENEKILTAFMDNIANI